MNSAIELVERIETAGGVLALTAGERIEYDLPSELVPLLEVLRAKKGEVIQVLRERQQIPAMPPGVRLLSWKLKEAPVAIETYAIVFNPSQFARMTLLQLEAALRGKRWLAGHWSAEFLIDRLRQVGVEVELETQ